MTPTQNLASEDLYYLKQLSDTNPLLISFYQDLKDSDNPLHLRLFQLNQPIPLSDILPMLENMSIKTLRENSSEIKLKKKTAWVSDLIIAYSQNQALKIRSVKNLFEDAFIKTYKGINENDGFNKLILNAQVSWEDVNIIRAYTKYLKQIRFRFSQHYIEEIISQHSDITKHLINLFKVMHNPNQKNRKKIILKTNKTIEKELEKITSLDEDTILRNLWLTIKATLRTNYFQKNQSQHKEYLSFKLLSSEVPELPLPHPLYEIFVYSSRFEAIHLRSTKVSRGGIRWSDRPEDFRTEILGLMKAQKVKNSVIVPSGAKGGFVLKAVPKNAGRELIQQEVIFCYKSFIRGLLDLTDNLKEKKIIRPSNVVCYDDPDTYLVVAADKGTASFSDIANSISKEYNFWLGDAFASGGSAGYDHKKMGITAKGAWESIKRHFIELNIDIEKKEFTAVGIGDMSGDVFGNGALYTPTMKLIAAFDHRHIFLDPNPNPAKTFQERLRLFKLPSSSWENFNSKLISKGGGIFKRTEKSILITPEVKKALDISENYLTPNELIRAILRAPVDLLFNGGIGTYVKASYENHAEVGDKSNEFCRINGSDLRCKVVGEGGNLGFTQLGRVEYALKGGLINADFIDNSAGVDCSDHEVNIKILLNQEMAKGKLTEKNRNALLVKMTKEIAELVLNDNYYQALVMSFSSLHSLKYTNLYAQLLKDLETSGVINRSVEFLPDDKKIQERQSSGVGFTRPELAALLAYSKIHIKNEILKSNIPEDSYFNEILKSAFPSALHKKYSKQLEEHSLKREIIATQLSNQIVNMMGITFIYRLQVETGASIAEIVRAYTIASHIYKAHELEQLALKLDFKIPVSTQYTLLHNIRRLLNLSTRWFLYNDRSKGDLKEIINHYALAIQKVGKTVPNLMTGITKEYLIKNTNELVGMGLERNIAERFALLRGMYTVLNVIEVAKQHHLDLIHSSNVYFNVGNYFNFVWFRDQIINDSREGHWNTLARLSLRDELDLLQRKIALIIIKDNKKEKDSIKLIEKWRLNHKSIIEKWERIFQLVCSSANVDYVMFFVALRELANLIQERK